MTKIKIGTMKREFWIRLGVALLIVLLLWWLYMAMVVDEDEAFALADMSGLLPHTGISC